MRRDLPSFAKDCEVDAGGTPKHSSFLCNPNLTGDGFFDLSELEHYL